MLAIGLLLLSQASLQGQQIAAPVPQKTIVERYGQLSVKGNRIVSQYGDTVQLRGMSFFWSQWMGQYYNKDVVKWLKDDWKCTVVRAALGVDNGGYMDQPYEEKEKVLKVIKAAIDQGIYVIIDFHSHIAYQELDQAKDFFEEMAKKFGAMPNVLYEVYNEPLGETSWPEEIKPYEVEVIKTIRKYDPDNIVICGNRQWSQMMDEAASDPIDDPNVAYTLHFYAASHGQELRDNAVRAMNKGKAIFCTEYGTCDYTGNGKLDSAATKVWWDFLDSYKISWCNWSIADKEETSSALTFGASWSGKWKENKLTPSGKFVRQELIKKNTPILEGK